MRARAGALLVLFLASSIALASSAAAAPTTRAECEAAGGKWGRLGLKPQEACNLPTRDAGKPCTDATDCVSACIAPDAAPEGSRAQGKCFDRELLVGTCLKQVRDGVVGPTLCAD